MPGSLLSLRGSVAGQTRSPATFCSAAGEPILELAVPITESVEAKMEGRQFGRYPAGAIIGASALFDPRLPQLEAIAGESCRVLWLPISAIKERAQRDSQLARTLDRVAREDLARKLERIVLLIAGGAQTGSAPTW